MTAVEPVSPRHPRALGLLLAASVVLLLSACHAHGATFTVDTVADTADVAPGDGICADAGGDCSLRAAVMESNALAGIQKIELAPNTTYTLSLAGDGEDATATGDLDLLDGVDLVGHASTIDAGGLDRVLDVLAPSGLVYLEGVTLTGGAAPNGAGLLARGGASVRIHSVHVTHSTASVGAPVEVRAGSLGMVASTVSEASGAAAGALLAHNASADLAQTTVSGTTATAGPAVANGPGATTTIDHSTIAANTTTTGALADTSGGMTVLRTIVADQVVGPDCAGPVTSGGYNVASDTSCALTGTGDQESAMARLGPLVADGPVPVHVPEPSGDGVDTIVGACRGVGDARLLPRRVGSGCDVGAVELQRLTVDSGADSRDASIGDGACSDAVGACTLRAAVDEANAMAGEQTITIDPAVTLLGLTRVGLDDANNTGDIDVTDPVRIVGNGATLRRDGGFDRILHAHTNLTISDLTLMLGYAGNGPGGAILTEAGTLTVDTTAFAFNESDTNGGAIAVVGTAAASITDSTFTQGFAANGGGAAIWIDTTSSDVRLDGVTIDDNSAYQPGGAIAATAGHLSLDSSAITNNNAYFGGGGIAVTGSATATITNTALVGNSTINNGGAVLLGSGVTGVELINTTIHDNNANGQGGGIYASDGATATLRFATITDNTPNSTLATDPTGQIQLAASILADTGANCPAAPANNITTLGHNIATDTTCLPTAGTDLADTDPLLDPFDPTTNLALPGPLPVGRTGDYDAC